MFSGNPYDQTRLYDKVMATNQKHEGWLLEGGFEGLVHRLGVRNITKENIVVLFTGGIDSTTILKAILDAQRKYGSHGNVYPLQVLRENMPSIELVTGERICDALNVSIHRVNYPENQPETYMIYMNLAHQFGEQVRATKILVGHVLTDRYNAEKSPDLGSSLRENRWFRKIRLTTGSHHAKVISPFGYITKSAVIEYAKKIGVPLEMTVSCPYYADNVGPCGTCPQCLDRQVNLSYISKNDSSL